MKKIIFICLLLSFTRICFGSDVVHKTTMQYRRSVNTPDYMTGDWLINPVIPGCAQKYWKLNGAGTNLEEMDAGEKAVIDAAQAAYEAKLKDITQSVDKLVKAALLVLLDEINVLRANPTSAYSELEMSAFKQKIIDKYDSL